MKGSVFRSTFVIAGTLLLCCSSSLGLARGPLDDLGSQSVPARSAVAPASFEDPNLAQCIADQGADPSTTWLVCFDYDISALGGIEVFTALQDLFLWTNQISDLAPLAGLTALESIDLHYNQISDFAPLAGLTALESIDLRYNQISDLPSLAGLTALEFLDLSYNQISDLAPLAGLTALQVLALSDNQISNLAPLAGSTALRAVYLWGNQISDLAPLAGSTALRAVYLSDNQISDLAPLAGLTALKAIYIEDNQISDLSPLAGLTALKVIDISNNHISDLASLPRLDGSDWGYLGLDSNPEITDVRPLLSQSWITINLFRNNHIPCEQLDTLLARQDLWIYPPDKCVGSQPICPAEAALTGRPVADTWLGDLRALRDQVLAGSDTGRRLIGIYYRHSQEVSGRLLADPRLALRAVGLLRLLHSDLLDLTLGITPVIDARESAAIRNFATRLMVGAGPALATELQWLLDADLAALLREIGARPDALASSRDGRPVNVASPTHSR